MPTMTETTTNGARSSQLRLAPLPTRRRPVLAVLAVVLVAAGALGTTSAIAQASHRRALIVLAADVPAGAAITRGDLSTAEVSASGLAGMPASGAESALGRRAAVALVKGSLLVPDDLASGPALARGEEVVGVALRPGQLPAEGLVSGDHVAVVSTPAPGSTDAASSAPAGQGGPGSVLVPDAVVYATSLPPANSPGSEAEVVSLLVPADLAGPLAAAAAPGEVALVLESER